MKKGIIVCCVVIVAWITVSLWQQIRLEQYGSPFLFQNVNAQTTPPPPPPGETLVDCYYYYTLGFGTIDGCEGPAVDPPGTCSKIAFAQGHSSYMRKCYKKNTPPQ